MGWVETDGCLIGDGPADAVGDSLKRVARDQMERTGRLPSGEAIFGSLVAALNLDGHLAPFYKERKRIAELRIHQGSKVLSVTARHAVPEIVAIFHAMLDEVAQEYLETAKRPPTAKEVLEYFCCCDREGLAEISSDTERWKIESTRVVFDAERKPADRSEPPTMASRGRAAQQRVCHPKYGTGTVVEDQGDRLRVQFAGGDVRTMLRSHLQLGSDE